MDLPEAVVMLSETILDTSESSLPFFLNSLLTSIALREKIDTDAAKEDSRKVSDNSDE